MLINGPITVFRRGVVKVVHEDGSGIVRGLTSWSAEEGVDIILPADSVRFLDVDVNGRNLSFGPRYKTHEDKLQLTTLRPPVVGDLIMYASKFDDDHLRVTNWTYATYYEECEGRLPRCLAQCPKTPLLGHYYCQQHQDQESGFYDNEDDDEPTLAEVRGRAAKCFPGNPEMAAEAASQFPGDFI